MKLATDPLTSEDAKELEATAGTIRAEKVKAEKAAAAAKSKGTVEGYNSCLVARTSWQQLAMCEDTLEVCRVADAILRLAQLHTVTGHACAGLDVGCP